MISPQHKGAEAQRIVLCNRSEAMGEAEGRLIAPARSSSRVLSFPLTEAFICEERIGNLLAGPWSSWL